MGRLTSDERRRIFVAQQQSAGEVLTPVRAAPIALEHVAPWPRRRLLAAVMIVMLLSGGWVASHPVELHLPASIAEALMPQVE
jgi:hypothetical protein